MSKKEMGNNTLTLESEFRRQSSKVTFRGDCVTVSRVTSEDGEPERFRVEPSEGQQVMLVNQRGSMLIRRSDESGWDVIPPGSMAMVLGPGPVQGIVPRGEHVTHWVSWNRDSAHMLARWLEDQRKVRTDASTMAVVKASTPENASLVREVVDSISGASKIVEPRLFGALQMIAATTVNCSEEMVLTATPVELAEGLRSLVEAVRAEPVKDWSLKVAAQVAGYSQYHLSRTFRNELGYGLPEFVERCRVELALKQINSGNRDFNEVAIASGFATPSAFREALKKIVGVLPSELRRMTH